MPGSGASVLNASARPYTGASDERAAYYAPRHTPVAVSFWRPRLPTLYLLYTQLPAGVAPDGNVVVVRAAAPAPTMFRLLCESGVVDFP